MTAQECIQQVDCVIDGFEALNALRSNRYDALITELIMPRVDGFGVLEQLNLGLVEVPPMVIMISAMRQEDMVRRACILGAKYFMVKPVEPETLYKRMTDLLENSYAGNPRSAPSAPLRARWMKR